MAPGSHVKLQVWRDGKTQDFTVTLGELPEKAEKASEGENSGGALEGVEVQNLTSEIAQELNLPAGTRGVVVTSVDPSSPAAATGIDRGVVIQEVNHKPVNNLAQYKEALAAAGNQPVLLLINQAGVTRYVVIETH
jgi:serine protease Do